jgi:hypothetical protein
LTGSLRDGLLHRGAEQMAAMARQIPDSQLMLLNGGDHPLMWSRARWCRQVADGFLAGVVEAGAEPGG